MTDAIADKITGAKPLVEMRDIRKRYGGVHALQGADLTIYPGEIHGLLGDNAAGKSTLIKILSGAVIRDTGDILFDGKRVNISNPRDAKALGVETVYQDLALADNLDIASNLFLGREICHGGLARPFLSVRRMEKEAASLLSRLKINIPNIKQRVHNMSGGQRQCVAIARSVYFNARVIILDEPTAALGVHETEKVFALVREMREQGHSVLMISHNLNHVFEICDRVTVMKTGRVAGTRHVTETDKEDVVTMIMTGAPSPTRNKNAKAGGLETAYA
jgi:D-xylose transport system ATP-binding protein